MKIIVGLGNPGRQYANTRHNAGYMVVDRLIERHAPGESVRLKHQADTVEARIGGEKTLLMKPVTYMNRSGVSVQDAARFYKIDPASDLLIVTDDLSLPVGTIRVRASGSDGGHNGLKDITRALGGDGYPRLRVGIDAKPPFMDQADWVLSRFADEDGAKVESAIAQAADAAECFIAEGAVGAMNKFNRKVKEKPESAKDSKADARADREPETEPGVDPGWLGGN
ncbi:MAG: aminoacyl-tRNA hydrolase [Phycisphaerales bacterium]|nr:aminoacyl-tRNA hydrolase [Phycisphaerales bacterium]